MGAEEQVGQDAGAGHCASGTASDLLHVSCVYQEPLSALCVDHLILPSQPS